MPIFAVLLALILFPQETYAHPGKTNYQGGHRCLKKCEEWNLYYAEYHLHDKDGKPIRVAKKVRAGKNKAQPEEISSLPAAVEEPVVPMIPPPSPAPVRTAAFTPEPESPYLLWLLILLLLLLLLFRRRAEQRSRKNTN